MGRICISQQLDYPGNFVNEIPSLFTELVYVSITLSFFIMDPSSSLVTIISLFE